MWQGDEQMSFSQTKAQHLLAQKKENDVLDVHFVPLQSSSLILWSGNSVLHRFNSALLLSYLANVPGSRNTS